MNKIFYNFIWNGGRDRVQRKVMCNDYNDAGLRMIDPAIFFIAQKMVWVRHLLDENYNALWKTIEISFLAKFNPDVSLLWKAHAPECILNSLKNIQLADSLRCWYLFRENATIEFYDSKYSQLSACQSIWYNKCIRSKSKQYFYYPSWFVKNVCTISDLFNPPLPGHKLFEELVLDFNIPFSERRKFNFLMKNIPNDWLENCDTDIVGVHDTVVLKLLSFKKVPKGVYNLLLGNSCPDKRYAFWQCNLPVQPNINWNKTHNTNFLCTIDTKLRSFYFKIFHNAIALNNFLFKIKRKDSPNCAFCDEQEETMVHLFCDCDKVIHIWQDLLTLINQKCNLNINISNFEKLFGICNDKFLTLLFLLLKYHIYCCKFSGNLPNFASFKSLVSKQKETEFYLAKKRNKLPVHFKKWRFDIS